MAIDKLDIQEIILHMSVEEQEELHNYLEKTHKFRTYSSVECDLLDYYKDDDNKLLDDLDIIAKQNDDKLIQTPSIAEGRLSGLVAAKGIILHSKDLNQALNSINNAIDQHIEVFGK